MEPAERATSGILLKHEYFTHDKFSDTFLPELLEIIQEENQANPLLQAKHSSISHQRTNKGIWIKMDSEKTTTSNFCFNHFRNISFYQNNFRIFRVLFETKILLAYDISK